MSDFIQLDVRDDGVAIMTLNRPESLNALNGEVLDTLPAVLQEVADDPRIRALVLTGAGRAFSAGGDIKGGGSGAPRARQLTLREAEEASRLLFEMPKPTIAAINGPAFGAGFCLALACDFRIASEAARFGTAFSRIGFSGDFGGTWLLPRIVGWAVAKELYLLAEPIDAKTALDLRIVRAVVPPEQLMDEAMKLAVRLANGTTTAYGLIKNNFAHAATATLADHLTREADNMAIAMQTEEHREAVTAFIEKREPVFKRS